MTKDRPATLKVVATRYDVHPGDDPSPREFTIEAGTPPKKILRLAADRHWLPATQGNQSIASKTILAVLAYEWPEIRTMPFLAERMRDADWRGGTLYLHFNYHPTDDPEVVYRVLQDLRLRP